VIIQIYPCVEQNNGIVTWGVGQTWLQGCQTKRYCMHLPFSECMHSICTSQTNKVYLNNQCVETKGEQMKCNHLTYFSVK